MRTKFWAGGKCSLIESVPDTFSLMGCDSLSSRVKIIARKFWLISAQARWSVNMMIARDFSEMGLIWTRLRRNYNKLKEAWIFCCKSLCFSIVSVGGCYPGDISLLPFILSFTGLSFTTPLCAQSDCHTHFPHSLHFFFQYCYKCLQMELFMVCGGYCG